MDVSPIQPHLDLFTMKAMSLVTMMVVTAAALLAWHVNRRVAGMRLFTFGITTITIGGLLGLGRLAIPGNFIIALCNVVMVGGLITCSQGIREFRGLRKFPPIVVGLVSLPAALFYSHYLYQVDDLGMRVGIVSLMFAIVATSASLALARRVPVGQRLVLWSPAFAFAFTAAYSSVRAWEAFTGHYGPNFLSPVPTEIATTICANIAFILCAFGMVVASNTLLRRDAETMALRDPLTNLPNRRLFLERLQDAEIRARATGHKFGLIYLDLDAFKQVNDLWGHDVGDALLRGVSASMLRALRSSDCLGRIGGDEFVALVEGVNNRREVDILASRLKHAAESIHSDGGYTLSTRVSCGLAVFPDDGATSHDVMRAADAEMYRSKQRARKDENNPAPALSTKAVRAEKTRDARRGR